MWLLFQFSFMMTLAGVQGQQSLPRTPIIIGPFAATCSKDAQALCEDYRAAMHTEFPHARFIGDCYSTQPIVIEGNGNQER